MSARKKVAPRRYPPIPKSVMGAGGLIDVAVVQKVDAAEADDEHVLGVFKATARRIEILKGLRADQRWLVFFHELTHAALWDSGAMNGMSEAQQESVCDAVATQRLREKFG
jgi:hypothetical protein